MDSIGSFGDFVPAVTGEVLDDSITSSDNAQIRSRDTGVRWEVYYCETEGREYYYEPNSRTATWVVPDASNSDPSSWLTSIYTDFSVPSDESRLKEQEEIEQYELLKMRREKRGFRQHVSFEDQLEKGDKSEENDMHLVGETQSSKMAFSKVYLLLSIMVTVGVLIGFTANWQRSKHIALHEATNGRERDHVFLVDNNERASSVEVKRLSPANSSLLQSTDYASVPGKVPVAVTNVLREELHASANVPQNEVEVDAFLRREMPDVGVSVSTLELISAGACDENLPSTLGSATVSTGELSAKKVITATNKLMISPLFNNAPDKHITDNIVRSRDDANKHDNADLKAFTTEMRRPRLCFLPFAVLVSKLCRSIAKETPIFDLGGLINSMME